jgi:hypothetical protein
MSRRRFRILTLLTLFAPAVGFLGWLAVKKSTKPLTPIAKVPLGITEKEVEAIFGRPANGRGLLLINWDDYYVVEYEGTVKKDDNEQRWWALREHNGIAILWFDDESGQLRYKCWYEAKRSLFSEFRAWLRF